jgi:hypothetical protein
MKIVAKALLRPFVRPLIERIAHAVWDRTKPIEERTAVIERDIRQLAAQASDLSARVDRIEEHMHDIKHLLVQQSEEPKTILRCLGIDDYSKEGLNVQIQTTSACTGNCIICPYPESWHRKNPGTMPDEVFQTIIEQLAEYPLRKICPYLENEPLADPLIFHRIQAIRDAFPNTLIEVSTNALALSPEKTRALIDALAGGPHDIRISFHGVNQRTFEGIMGIPFERCLANTVHLLKTAQSIPLHITLNGAGMGRVVGLRHEFAFSEQEYHEFWEDVFRQNGIKSQPQITFFTYHDRAMSIKRNDIRLSRPVRADLEGFSCPRVSQWAHFLYTGELILCCMDYHRETVFADIRKQRLSDILHGKDMARMMKQVTGLASTSPRFICKRCISPGG